VKRENSPVADGAGATALLIEPMGRQHWTRVREIYRLGIATGHATFEVKPPSWQAFTASRLPEHRLVVAAPSGEVVGWAALSAVSSRPVYAGVVEHSVYVHPAASGTGVGRRLLEALITSTERAGIWTIQSGIFPENVASLRLHGACGFREVGVHSRYGLMTYGPMAGVWRDVVLVERRSPGRE
jgi:phosphinothricin acetyltransferase